ncbi:peptide deformylase [Bifidobacterium ruminantium]|uniref:Peptide deformylase n=1 Tax=Bifidobacterium ruminantium TaxID=78346 RepID=A0A087CWL1_BIFRU|nr:peptide deformylase [Bifidobacterium ruminantium]KFI87661.1 peptide deformylase [Bifidobacterium ruminantium]MBU9111742.1 peptide deformylase [Bifidobacterium ruminantium]MEE0970804.1 peptide deformylase [Bifidobacterium ruminantium]
MQREIMTSIPFLSQPSVEAENTEADLAVAQDLKDTLDAHRNGCVGMAANMIGVSKRIIAFVDKELGDRITIMFNPHITARDGAYDTAEGCLSLKGERRTLRYQRIEVTYLDRRWRERHAAFTGFTAQIIQHEIDHCDGVII